MEKFLNKAWLFIKYLFTNSCPKCGGTNILFIYDTEIRDSDFVHWPEPYDVDCCQDCGWSN